MVGREVACARSERVRTAEVGEPVLEGEGSGRSATAAARRCVACR